MFRRRNSSAVQYYHTITSFTAINAKHSQLRIMYHQDFSLSRKIILTNEVSLLDQAIIDNDIRYKFLRNFQKMCIGGAVCVIDNSTNSFVKFNLFLSEEVHGIRITASSKSRHSFIHSFI